jgi:Protein of unknown function (DUF2924)
MDVSELTVLGTDMLRQRWSELYGMEPAPRISRDVLIRGVAYRIQEEAYGGLGKACRRQLQRRAVSLRDGGLMSASQGQSFKPGTKLIREWKGKVHEVVIAGDTYIWAGKHYRSLSQIARAITGTRWSGPRFFGLEAGQEVGQRAASKSISTPVTKGARTRAGTVAQVFPGAADV